MPTHASPSLDEFFRSSYRDLRRMARARLRANRSLTLLDTTALVHECYLKMRRGDRNGDHEISHSFGYLAHTMRSVVVDFVRRRQAQRRNDGLPAESLDELTVALERPDDEVLEVDAALEVLARVEPRLVQVVEMKYFGGFSEREIAQAMGVDPRTVRRDWQKARVMLRGALGR